MAVRGTLSSRYQQAPGALINSLMRLYDKDAAVCRCLVRVWKPGSPAGLLGSSLFVPGSLGRRVRTHRLGLLLIGTSGSSVSWCGQPGEESPSWLGPATSLLCKVLG